MTTIRRNDIHRPMMPGSKSGCYIPTSIEQVSFPPLNGIGELNLSVVFIYQFYYCQIVITFDCSANSPPHMPRERIFHLLLGRSSHTVRLPDFSKASSYTISIILNGCLVYVEGMLIQAPLTSTTKSCSLGCKLPPPFTFGEVVNFQIHTQSLISW